MRAHMRGAVPVLLLVLQSLLFTAIDAAFVTFENCLPDSTQNSDLLKFTPSFVNATFINTAGSTHDLDLTIYGNVSGRQYQEPLPAGNDSYWSNDNETNGKIVNVAQGGNYTTLIADYTVLTFTAYNNQGEQFCSTLNNNESCPLSPVFDFNASDYSIYPSFSLSHSFDSSYAFATISATVHVLSGDEGAQDIACISVQVTPDLGPTIRGLLTWLAAAVLILKGLATLVAAIWSPWGTPDIFKWSSNYGRDEDLLRLVTPGFGDCLQYIQFIFLTGSLTLQYPGYFRPAVRQVAWSSLLFNESFVSGGNNTEALVDGLYKTNATYGLTKMSQLVGMSKARDMWACMAIFLLVIVAAVVVLCQLGFAARWIYHKATLTAEEDLQKKNIPFTLGNIIRLIFNYFLLPIVSLSLFQLLIAGRSPTSVVVCAILLLVIVIVWAGWALKVIFNTKPRTLLFDDMPTVLCYGPFYNTYSDNAAPFSLVPNFITFLRGIAIGAIQPTGVGQIIVLAICEVILILTLNGFRPFQGQTSMNLYHTFYAVARLVVVLLMIAFVPSLGVTEAPKGWIGYAILLVHACVLVFGFLLNAMQTIIEVVARSMGAGHDAQNGAVRGSVLNWRSLKKRPDRRDVSRGSMSSNAAILRDATTDANYATRSRSVSASSQQLLNRMSGFENFSSGGDHTNSSPDPGSEATPMGTMTDEDGKPVVGIKTSGDNYYRPPRPRKNTMDPLTPGTRTRSTADFPYADSPGHARDNSYDSGGPHGSPAPAYFRGRTDSNDDTNRADYAVREVDQYYRGPALNDQPSRKLKTGPADPEGPASTAQSWFKNLVFGVKGKKKEPGKGFEVVRRPRMPSGMQDPAAVNEALELQQSPAMLTEPYRDSPHIAQEEVQAVAGAQHGMPSSSLERSMSTTDDIASRPPAQPAEHVFDLHFDGTSHTLQGTVRPESETIGRLSHPVLEPISTEHRASLGPAAKLRRLSQETADSHHPGQESMHNANEQQTSIYSDQPTPFLDPIDSVGTIDLPSRFNSTTGSRAAPSRYNSSASTAVSGPTRLMSNRSGPPQLGQLDVGNDQDWLREVQNLSWNHTSRQPSVRSSEPAVSQPAPSVPRRNSRRTLSQDVAAQRYRPQSTNIFEGFDSTVSPENPASPTEEEPSRQTPGRVVHHRAGDSITRNSLGANAMMMGSSAEIEYLRRESAANADHVEKGQNDVFRD
ncbi:hypothetical protein DOTSEDRAFT_70718 [Dothistroma septosporum NZE10]|uniref:ML-like domain-containing protein n=1 Tax=Dothistroma septosporum (strain NZE10 / CBS 128990) TaxID=675120 RepID=N1PV75_DOTSN|nr:hypothetical protein DOTSEDRAFT_70718 [Dothistroma septosporum NZE10]